MKKTHTRSRKHALVQEKKYSHKKKDLAQDNTLSNKKASKKNRKKLFFLIVFLVGSLFSCASSFFLDRVRACFLERVRIILFSYFLFFFCKLPAQITFSVLPYVYLSARPCNSFLLAAHSAFIYPPSHCFFFYCNLSVPQFPIQLIYSIYYIYIYVTNPKQRF